MWLFHLASLDKVTPKCLWLIVIGILFPLNEKLKLYPPNFEYACEIWDNCGVCYSTKLENLQLDAARIVTGLPIFTKTNKLYSFCAI
jgi:hypothetical protein